MATIYWILGFILFHLPFIGYILDYRKTKNKSFLYAIGGVYFFFLLAFVLLRYFSVLVIIPIFLSAFILLILIKYGNRKQL